MQYILFGGGPLKLPDLVLPQKDIDDMGRPLENDLLALFKLLEEDTLRLLDRAKDEGWTPEEFEREIEALIMGDTRPTQVQKTMKAIGEQLTVAKSLLSEKPKYKLFLDLDGVLADFDSGYEDLIGKKNDKDEMTNAQEKAMWKAIEDYGTFYLDLPMTSDGMELFDYCKPLNPTILTGVPRVKNASEQKREWCAEHLGQDIPVITCLSREKITEANKVTPSGVVPVLVDDWSKFKEVWESGGGVFVLHTSASDSIKQLKKLGL